MKVYIPFNTNDFNSVFTTLSISPCSYYPNRKYSFKRASRSSLNENEDFLIGYEKPIFHNRKFDKDYGFPVLLEVIIDKKDTDLLTDKTGIKFVVINSTIYLFNGFKLIFRKEDELNETLAKSLKSIETKFANLAKANSSVIEKNCYVDNLPSPKTPSKNEEINRNTFIKERKLNRILGVILGSSIAFSNSTSKEWQEISNLLRLLNNNLSLYLNKIGESNGFEKKKSLEIIKKVSSIYESIETLDEVIMQMTEPKISSNVLYFFKSYKIFRMSYNELVIEGILASIKIDLLPIPLKFEKLTRAINSKFNSKYPSNYTVKINKIFNEIKLNIEKQITLSRKDNKLNLDNLITPKFVNGSLEVKIPESLNQSEKEYLTQTLLYFIQTDTIVDVEYFFVNRKKILGEIGNHFKSHIQEFDKSEEQEYLRTLFKSFDNLRSGFEIYSIQNEVLKSIAILFTLGRNFLRYIENNEKEGIQPIIYYSLWGAIYGAAILPKTITELITDDENNLQIIITAFNSALNNYEPVKEGDNSIGNGQPSNSDKKSISKLATKVIEVLETKKKVKLSELKSLSKDFKNHDDVKELVKNELSKNVIVKKEGSTMYAFLK